MQSTIWTLLGQSRMMPKNLHLPKGHLPAEPNALGFCPDPQAHRAMNWQDWMTGSGWHPMLPVCARLKDRPVHGSSMQLGLIQLGHHFEPQCPQTEGSTRKGYPTAAGLTLEKACVHLSLANQLELNLDIILSNHMGRPCLPAWPSHRDG